MIYTDKTNSLKKWHSGEDFFGNIGQYSFIISYRTIAIILRLSSVLLYRGSLYREVLDTVYLVPLNVCDKILKLKTLTFSHFYDLYQWDNQFKKSNNGQYCFIISFIPRGKIVVGGLSWSLAFDQMTFFSAKLIYICRHFCFINSKLLIKKIEKKLIQHIG